MQAHKGGLVLAVLGLALLPSLAMATQLVGTPVDIGGSDDASSTIWGFMTGNWGRVVVAGLLAGFPIGLVRGYAGTGVLSLVAGVVTMFIPGMATTGMDAVPAATGSVAAPVSFLAQVWQGLTGARLPVDPVFVVLLAAVVLLSVYGARRQQVAG